MSVGMNPESDYFTVIVIIILQIIPPVVDLYLIASASIVNRTICVIPWSGVNMSILAAIVTNVVIVVQLVSCLENVFLSDQYDFSVPENSAVGDTLNTLNIYCQKTEGLVFSIQPMTKYFVLRVVPNKAILRAVVTFDREKTNLYRFDIIARENNSTPTVVATAKIIVTITDKNDNLPIFFKTVYRFHISENNSPGVEVGRIWATDRDMGSNAEVSYQIANEEYFAIDRTGTLLATRSLDREKNEYFQFQVVATDHGLPPLSSTATAYITITDENDNTPQLIFPPRTDFTINVSVSTQTATHLLKVIASDKDAGQNGIVQYNLLSSVSSNQDLFVVLSSGDIYTKRNFTRGDLGLRKLFINITDRGYPRARSIVVSIIIRIVNDNGLLYEREPTAMTTSQPIKPPHSNGQNVLRNNKHLLTSLRAVSITAAVLGVALLLSIVLLLKVLLGKPRIFAQQERISHAGKEQNAHASNDNSKIDSNQTNC